MFETYITTVLAVLTGLWLHDKLEAWRERRRYGGRW